MEVIERFRTQNRTNKSLEGQSDQAEKDIRDMSDLKETLEKDLQATSFLGQDDDVKVPTYHSASTPVFLLHIVLV